MKELPLYTPMERQTQTPFVIRMGTHDSRGFQRLIFVLHFASSHSLHKQYLTFLLFKCTLFLSPPFFLLSPQQETVRTRGESGLAAVRQRGGETASALSQLLLWSSGNEPEWDFFRTITPPLALEYISEATMSRVLSGQSEGVLQGPYTCSRVGWKTGSLPHGKFQHSKACFVRWLGTSKTFFSMKVSSKKKISWKH